ncbi:MAG: NADH-quinone oxidoreductase subunit C [Desulfurococcales archaeon]|nr:NADH-quinone oxidoreductase subunit C [Desulfurococcales archaeon]
MKVGRVVVILDPEKVEEAFRKLQERYGYLNVYLSTIVGTDLKSEGKIRMDYYVNVFSESTYVVLRTFIERDDPKIKTMLNISKAAFSGECETYDLLGVKFEGNPYLKRSFFVPKDVAEKGVFPLRKDSGV